MSDNPDFDVYKIETWTGNAAEYIETMYYGYLITYTLENRGEVAAYDCELDIICKFQTR